MLHRPTSNISIDDLTQNTPLELALSKHYQRCNNEHQMLMLGVRCGAALKLMASNGD